MMLRLHYNFIKRCQPLQQLQFVKPAKRNQQTPTNYRKVTKAPQNLDPNPVAFRWRPNVLSLYRQSRCFVVIIFYLIKLPNQTLETVPVPIIDINHRLLQICYRWLATDACIIIKEVTITTFHVRNNNTFSRMIVRFLFLLKSNLTQVQTSKFNFRQ